MHSPRGTHHHQVAARTSQIHSLKHICFSNSIFTAYFKNLILLSSFPSV